jgi:hypothetical protein
MRAGEMFREADNAALGLNVGHFDLNVGQSCLEQAQESSQTLSAVWIIEQLEIIG